MKHTKINFVKKGMLILFTMAILTNSTYADLQNELKCRDKNAAVANLIHGIKSDNLGLMKSSVYFAGKYRVKEAVPALISELNSAKDSNCKVLIALSLYLIGDERGIEAVFKIAKTDRNERVRHMCNAIYAEFSKNKLNRDFIAEIKLF
ncbi:MAG TPA: HEAT repeat domain-containing protein [Melioribacteraceae bacterium]|nr:HEAT repeat domain-containing protein [Melioribacteraceae bacterium]